MIKLTNNTLEANGDIYIIPKDIIKVSDESAYIYDILNKVLEKSGYKRKGHSDLYVFNACIVSKDLDTDDLLNKGGKYLDQSGVVNTISSIPSLIPVDPFINFDDGDVVDIVYPRSSLYDIGDNELILHLRLAQKEYKYHDFGTFRTLFDRLLLQYSRNLMAGNRFRMMEVL